VREIERGSLAARKIVVVVPATSEGLDGRRLRG
jgi:hypothetical protein